MEGMEAVRVQEEHHPFVGVGLPRGEAPLAHEVGELPAGDGAVGHLVEVGDLLGDAVLLEAEIGLGKADDGVALGVGDAYGHLDEAHGHLLPELGGEERRGQAGQEDKGALHFGPPFVLMTTRSIMTLWSESFGLTTVTPTTEEPDRMARSAL